MDSFLGRQEAIFMLATNATRATVLIFSAGGSPKICLEIGYLISGKNIP